MAAIARVRGETVTVKDDDTWAVVDSVGHLDEVSPDLLQPSDDVIGPDIIVEREIDAFPHMPSLSMPGDYRQSGDVARIQRSMALETIHAA
jgi:hypothetical protein